MCEQNNYSSFICIKGFNRSRKDKCSASALYSFVVSNIQRINVRRTATNQAEPNSFGMSRKKKKSGQTS